MFSISANLNVFYSEWCIIPTELSWYDLCFWIDFCLPLNRSESLSQTPFCGKKILSLSHLEAWDKKIPTAAITRVCAQSKTDGLICVIYSLSDETRGVVVIFFLLRRKATARVAFKGPFVWSCFRLPDGLS